MTKKEIYKFIAFPASAAALMLAGMLSTSLFSGGITAQNFETVSNVEDYTRNIIAAEIPLRIILTFDNLFLMFYTAAFIFLAIDTWNETNIWLVVVALGALVITAYLDLHENHDLMTQLTTAINGMPISLADLQERMLWSQLKFHSSYLGFFLFAFVLPADTILEKFLKISLWFGYLPIGVLVYTFPNHIFDLMRYFFMLGGLFILGWNYFVRYRNAK